jgi:hypothetical protein
MRRDVARNVSTAGGRGVVLGDVARNVCTVDRRIVPTGDVARNVCTTDRRVDVFVILLSCCPVFFALIHPPIWLI